MRWAGHRNRIDDDRLPNAIKNITSAHKIARGNKENQLTRKDKLKMKEEGDRNSEMAEEIQRRKYTK